MTRAVTTLVFLICSLSANADAPVSATPTTTTPPASTAQADTPAVAQAPAPSQVKYKSGKSVDFEELLIQGRLKRPEVTVVTGDSGNGTDGLLKLREDFVDRMSVDMGETVQ